MDFDFVNYSRRSLLLFVMVANIIGWVAIVAVLYPTELMPQQKEHYRVMPFHPGFWYRNGCEMFFACQRSFGCALVSSEVSHRTAAMVSRCRACRAWLAHSGYPVGHVPRSPRTAIDACAIRRMLSHLEAHSAI